jgi:3-oxoacyl-[acyl-carrier protein] reductase
LVLVHYLRLPLGDEETVDRDESAQPGQVFYRKQQARSGQEVVATIRDRGGRAEGLEIDLAEPAAIPHLFNRAIALLGPVDVLVSNAAYCQPDTFIPSLGAVRPGEAPTGVRASTLTAESHDRHFSVNSRAVALMIGEYTRRHVERGAQWGRIITVSTDGAAGFPNEISYGASKAALESYSRAAATELGRLGITINVVSPGPIQTGYIPPELEPGIVDTIPLGRLGRPEDVADVIVFLASEQARWLTGQTLYVGGGHAM